MFSLGRLSWLFVDFGRCGSAFGIVWRWVFGAVLGVEVFVFDVWCWGVCGFDFCVLWFGGAVERGLEFRFRGVWVRVCGSLSSGVRVFGFRGGGLWVRLWGCSVPGVRLSQSFGCMVVGSWCAGL